MPIKLNCSLARIARHSTLCLSFETQTHGNDGDGVAFPRCGDTREAEVPNRRSESKAAVRWPALQDLCPRAQKRTFPRSVMSQKRPFTSALRMLIHNRKGPPRSISKQPRGAGSGRLSGDELSSDCLHHHEAPQLVAAGLRQFLVACGGPPPTAFSKV
jgi:hypothetical protein